MKITIKPAANTLNDWRKIYWGTDFELSNEAHSAINNGSAAVQAIVSKGNPVYGINTGFGKLASVRIDDADLATLQKNLVLSHSVGVGDYLEPNVVRLIAAIKVASLCQGASGARLSTIQMIVNVINSGLIPAVPAQGSVGASGDLAPLAHFIAALMGEGEFLVEGKAVPAMPILKKHGFEPLVLAAKEGLACLNGTQVSTGLALKGLFEVERAFHSSLISGAMALDGFKGTKVPFDARIHALRPHSGQIDVAASLWTLMKDSEIHASHQGKTRVQDPYSFRCMPQVLGSVLDSLRHSAKVLEIEARAVTDNPLIFDNGDVISGGNFHAEPTAFAADIIALATVEIGSMSERRGSLLLDSTISELPAFLAKNPGLNSGLMMGQITAAALTSETKQKAAPAVIDTIPTSGNQEDHVSMATHGARRLTPMAENIQAIVGIEVMLAAQAVDFHSPLKCSPLIQAAKDVFRTEVDFLEDDRWQKPDIAVAYRMVREGVFIDAVGLENLPII